MKKQLKISIGEYVSRGPKESAQEFHDICIPKEPQLSTKGIALALADGISSSESSHIATQTSIISFLTDYYSTPESWSIKKSAQRVLMATNSWLYAQNSKSKFQGDANRGYLCTMSALILRGERAHIFHVGDTRIYRLRNKKLEQLTEDHRLWVSEHKSYLSRALGIEPQLRIDYESFELLEGDTFIFMTDGLYESIEKESIVEILHEYRDDLHLGAQALTTEAYNEGSATTLSVQIARVERVGEANEHDLEEGNKNLPLAPALQKGDIFEGYTILEELSITQRSSLYLAYDSSREKRLVIKLPSEAMKSDSTYLERFLLQQWIASRIDSPYVVKPYEQERKKSYIYTLLEYKEGERLDVWMQKHPNPSLEEVSIIVEQIAKGLEAFHNLEMVHQDIDPKNILIDAQGDVTIIDFGSTRIEGIVDAHAYLQERQGASITAYTAPELLLSKSGTPSCDIFSLAMLAYTMLSGDKAYGEEYTSAKSRAQQKRLIYKELSLEDGVVPLWVEGCIKKALSIEPQERYSEVSEFLGDLEHPNRAFEQKEELSFFQRKPLLLWQILSFILLGITLIQLS